MTSDQIKRNVSKWASTIGRAKALQTMVIAGVSAAMAMKLVSGKYEPHLKHDNALKLIKLLKDEGVVVDEAC